MAVDTNINLRNQVMYSIYVRNYSEQGTFAAVERDLDRIRALGVDIIWLMPIHPIGEKARKGKLGSPYAISDYRKVNPEFGTLEDFISLVDAIHAKGMKCIIDVVYNHTSPDSWLAVNHPEYFYRTPEGKMGNRVGDWTDIVDLDYGNLELWDYQITTLKQWAKIVDGFRCDVAPLVPLDFWKRARKEVEQVRPGCLWLAESVEPEFIVKMRADGLAVLSDAEIFQAFDISYEYDVFPYFRAYLRGECPLSMYAEHVNMQAYIYPDNYVKLRYLENHDQDRAKAVIGSREALLQWTAFLYFQKGMTLLYAGQEKENDFRPDLFDRNPVLWNTGSDLSDYLSGLYEIKKRPLMAYGSYTLQAWDEKDILTGVYEKGSQKLIGIFNFKGKEAEIDVPLDDGEYENLAGHESITVHNGKVYSGKMPIIIENHS